MKPKHALVKDGFLPAGSENKRGRLSLDAINRLKELAGSGWDIDGYSVSKPTTSTGPVKVEKTKASDSSRVLDVPDEHRAEELWTAHTSEGEVGMRTVCNTCKCSLTYCWCPSPRVWIDHTQEGVVYFKPRTRPLANKRW